MSFTAQCPSCGAPIAFKIPGTVVIICESCDTVVARSDRALEDLGKVADPISTGAVLALGLRGHDGKTAFEIVGRAQLAHAAGGAWDEWYAHFADGRWGWLAEAQGQFYLTFPAAVKNLPEASGLVAGEPALIETPQAFVVAEHGRAKMASAAGEIPYRLVPGQAVEFADLSGPQGAFATIDYSDSPPSFYLGRQVTLAEIGIKPQAASDGPKVAAAALQCPHCAGPLSLHMPEKAERVVCPNCDGLLDLSHGKLQFLSLVKHPKETLVVPLGSKGTLDGIAWTAIGLVARAVTVEGTRYPWQEFLLYNREHGFRWLVFADGHFSLGESIAAGNLKQDKDVAKVSDGTNNYRLFQRSTPIVEYVLGEFYWRVEVGETVRSEDFVAPPFMLSKEVSAGDHGSEVNWTRLVYVMPDEVKKAFGLASIKPAPSGIAPNQPRHGGGYGKAWLLLVGLSLMLAIVFAGRAPEKAVFSEDVAFARVENADATQVAFLGPFHLNGNQNVELSARTALNNSWLFLQSDLIGEDNNLVQPSAFSLESYSGVEDGESWSEGEPQQTQYVSAMPSGEYTLRLEAQWKDFAQPASAHFEIKQGVWHASHLVWVWLLLTLIPMLSALRSGSFEKRRWEDSEFSPYGGE